MTPAASPPPEIHLPGGVQGLFQGFFALPRGAALVLGVPRLRGLSARPVLLSLAIYLGAFALAVAYVPGWLDAALPQPEAGALHWLWYALVPLVFGVLLVLLGISYVAVTGVLGGPFYERLAAEVLRGGGIPAPPGGSFVDGLASALLRTLCFVLPAALLGLFALIPLLTPILGPLALGVGWLGLGADVMDTVLSAAGRPAGARVGQVFRSPFFALGVGGGIALSLLVPGLVLLAIPSAIAGTARAARPA